MSYGLRLDAFAVFAFVLRSVNIWIRVVILAPNSDKYIWRRLTKVVHTFDPRSLALSSHPYLLYLM